MGRRFPAALAAAATAAMLFATSSSSASTSQESDFVSRINAERSARGIPTLAMKSDLAAVARDWAEHMAAAGSISHDPNLADKVSGWTALGDNVGKGPTVSSIHKAFMESETHRHIILDTDFNQVGVGVASSGGTLYVAQVFARRASGSVPKPVAKPKASALQSQHTAPVAAEIVTLTGRIWSIDLTAPPMTVDVLMQLLELDA
ncbi:MAG: CAP domain-containing protein [Actinomycetota bacterium]